MPPTTPEVLPALADSSKYELEKFTPVYEQDSDKDTTVSDLSMLNNMLALCDAAIPKINTIDSLVKISLTTCKLIETRRRVKKLPFGEPAGKKTPEDGFVVLK